MLTNLKNILNDLPAREVLGYIYAAYPETTSESAEYRKIRLQMGRITLSLIHKKTRRVTQPGSGKPRHHVIGLMKKAALPTSTRRRERRPAASFDASARGASYCGGSLPDRRDAWATQV